MSRIALVVRRVGGLEEMLLESGSHTDVVRRVGGLEVRRGLRPPASGVVRRVGGLEGVGGYYHM